MTFEHLIDSEGLQTKLQLLPCDQDVVFLVKAGLDGSGSHIRRQQLCGDGTADAHVVDNFVGVFVTPLAITSENCCIWKTHFQIQFI